MHRPANTTPGKNDVEGVIQYVEPVPPLWKITDAYIVVVLYSLVQKGNLAERKVNDASSSIKGMNEYIMNRSPVSLFHPHNTLGH